MAEMTYHTFKYQNLYREPALTSIQIFLTSLKSLPEEFGRNLKLNNSDDSDQNLFFYSLERRTDQMFWHDILYVLLYHNDNISYIKH